MQINVAVKQSGLPVTVVRLPGVTHKFKVGLFRMFEAFRDFHAAQNQPVYLP